MSNLPYFSTPSYYSGLECIFSVHLTWKIIHCIILHVKNVFFDACFIRWWNWDQILGTCLLIVTYILCLYQNYCIQVKLTPYFVAPLQFFAFSSILQVTIFDQMNNRNFRILIFVGILEQPILCEKETQLKVNCIFFDAKLSFKRYNCNKERVHLLVISMQS